jgi:hypothetical protein
LRLGARKAPEPETLLAKSKSATATTKTNPPGKYAYA